MMEEITQLLSSLPASIKYLVGGMFGLQILAFSVWMIMMLRESKNSNKEKQSWLALYGRGIVHLIALCGYKDILYITIMSEWESYDIESW